MSQGAMEASIIVDSYVITSRLLPEILRCIKRLSTILSEIFGEKRLSVQCVQEHEVVWV